jgi:FkbM family methyltransferase
MLGVRPVTNFPLPQATEKQPHAKDIAMDDIPLPDPIFHNFELFEGSVPAGFTVEITGALVSTNFKGMEDSEAQKERYVKTRYPSLNEDFFEYLSIFKAVSAARGKFVMVELGAGYGRWVVTAAKAIQRRKSPDPLSCFLVGVEADPTHFRMMTEHCRNNGIDPGDCRLIQAAVTDHRDGSWFTTGSPHIWWGQAVVPSNAYIGKQYPDQRNIRVDSIMLDDILQPLDSVDLIDMDVQGEEFNVLSSSPDALHAKVKRLHIGTHSRAVEKNIRKLMRRLRWTCEYDFPGERENRTPFGRMAFIDGIQTWVNTKLQP